MPVQSESLWRFYRTSEVKLSILRNAAKEVCWWEDLYTCKKIILSHLYMKS